MSKRFGLAVCVQNWRLLLPLLSHRILHHGLCQHNNHKGLAHPLHLQPPPSLPPSPPPLPHLVLDPGLANIDDQGDAHHDRVQVPVRVAPAHMWDSTTTQGHDMSATQLTHQADEHSFKNTISCRDNCMWL
jgi:hypothetical protein